MDNEYHVPEREEQTEAPEFSTPLDEFNNGIPSSDANGRKSQRKWRLKSSMIAAVASAMVITVAINDSFDIDLLNSGVAPIEEAEPEPEPDDGHNVTPEPEKGDTEIVAPPDEEPDEGGEEDIPSDEEPDEEIIEGDDAFPSLPNLEPNEYFMWGDEKRDEKYIYAEGIIYGGADILEYNTLTDVPGVTYNSATNTLTLNNAVVSLLEVNLMGNGFKINLIGQNHVARLVVWGFGYGGSVTFEGSGSLYLNEGAGFPSGLVLEAEGSESCVMVSPGVRLEVWGSEAALLVKDSYAEKGIYYLKGSKLTGERGEIPVEYSYYDESGNEIVETTAYYTIITEDGTPSTHFVIE